MPHPCPRESMRRQSASFWFQLAAWESARQPGTCSSPSACSVFTVTRLEVRRLAEIRHPGGDPVGLPVEHRGQRHARRAEELLRRARVDEPGCRRFIARDGGLLAETL